MRMPKEAVVVAGIVALASCGWFRSKPPKLFPVDLCLRASPKLQWYEDRPHTLYVRVFPLTVVDGFASAEVNQLLADPAPLIAGGVGVPQSRMVYPDTTVRLSFDASEGQTFSNLGIVAGYYDPEGAAKHVVSTADLRSGGCYTVDLGPSAIAGGAPVGGEEE